MPAGIPSTVNSSGLELVSSYSSEASLYTFIYGRSFSSILCVSVSTSAELPDVPVVPYGSSITTYIANLGFSAGACPINDIIHLLSFLSPFWAVPVLPATEYPVTPAFLAVPSSTVFLRYLLKSFDVEAVIVCLTSLQLHHWLIQFSLQYVAGKAYHH